MRAEMGTERPGNLSLTAGDQLVRTRAGQEFQAREPGAVRFKMVNQARRDG